MEELYVFGTGNAQATRCYNTCFAIRDGEEYFLVDAGGGNGILTVLEDIATAILKGSYEGNLNVYCRAGLVDTIRTLCALTIQKKFCNCIGERILLLPVEDGETRHILDYDVTFFDILSTKAKQFGFTTVLKNGRKLTCAGDEPYNPGCERHVAGSDWLLHEAFCLYGDRERFRPYEKHHSTVKDACELAERLRIPNLVLWHTEDKDLGHRKERYLAEGRLHYSGNLYVPDDGERLAL